MKMPKKAKDAFTLVELMIVVSILGILAAIVIPQFSYSTIQAKESAAKDTLNTWRNQIELYKMNHKGKTPGYKMGVGVNVTPDLINQFIGTSDENGVSVVSTIPVNPYKYGPYLKKIPTNPFNNKNTIIYVPNATAFATAATGNTGWLYKRETGEIRLNYPGTDGEGTAYVDY